MAGTQTHGFDLVIELSEARLGSVVGALVIPQSVTQSFPLGGQSVPITVSGRLIPTDGTTIRPGNLVDFRVTYSSVTIAGVTLGGATITIFTQIVESAGSPRQITVSFPSAPTIALQNPSALDGLLAVSGTGITRDQALALAANALRTYLQTAAALPSIPIGQMLGSGPCAPALADVRVRTIDHVMAILLAFSGTAISHPAPPDPTAFTSSGLAGRNAVMFVSNDTLLGLAACFASQPPSPIAGAAFTASGQCRRLARPTKVTLMGRNVTVNSLSVCVVGNRIVVDGSVHYSDTGFSIDGSFSAPMGFSCRADGSIGLDFNPDDVRTDVNLSIEWWVYLLAFFLIAIAAALLGAVVALILTIVVLVAAPIASAIINSLARGAIGNLGTSVAGSANTSLLPPQLQRILGAVHCDAVILDDLSLGGRLDSPRAAAVTLRPRSEITQRVETGRGGTGLFAYTTFRVARKLTYTAAPTSMVDPVSWAWNLAGAAATGSGARTLGGVVVSFAVSAATIEISTPLGADLDFVLAVHGRDHDGLVQSASTLVSVTPNETAYDAGSQYEILRTLTESALFPRGVPNLVIDPAGPDPPPDAFTRQQLTVDTVQAIAAGMNIDAAQLAKTAGVSLRSVSH